MKIIVIIRRLFAILMIAGLALAPLSRPVMAGAASDAPKSAMAGHQMDEMSAMTDDTAEMPCCPSKAPTPVDCDKCITMAGCMSSFLTWMPTAIVLPLPVVSDSVVVLSNDFRPDGRGDPPPEHPPRLLV